MVSNVKPPRFNGCNCNRINARIPNDYYHFEDSSYYSFDASKGDVVLCKMPFSENLGTVDCYSLSNLLASGISPQAVSMGLSSRFDGIVELDSFSNNNPDISFDN